MKEPIEEIGYHKESGIVAYRLWQIPGHDECFITHRIGAPALTEYYKDGKRSREVWVLNGKLHRLDGPAVVTYFSISQKPREETWYFNGIWLNYEIRRWLRKNGVKPPYSDEDVMAVTLMWKE